VVVDLDALRPAVAAGERERCASVPHAEQIVEEELREFREWMRGAAARAAIRPLCDALTEVCRREVAHAVSHGEGGATAEAAAERAAGRIVAKLLARPMVELRGAAARGEALDDLVVALHRLFPGHGRRRGDPSDARDRARELALRESERRAMRAAARAAGAVGTIGALAATPGLVLAPEATPIAVHARRRAR
jgi:hypothetical protein